MKYHGHIVPIPEGAIVRKTGDRKGQIYIIKDNLYNPITRQMEQKRVVIGRALEDGKNMIASPNYQEVFPALFAEQTGRKVFVSNALVAGPFLAALSIGQYLRLYPLLIRTLNPENANFIMDYAMYEIVNQSNVAMLYSPTMKNCVLFSERTYDDTWISEFFKNRLSEYDINLFNDSWVRTCVEDGIRSVWLSVDGSNSDCEAEEVGESESGKAKSGSKDGIVSYMTAVCAKTGRVVAYRLYRGGRIDSQELLDLMSYLKPFGIEAEGVIVDRGFCSIEDLEAIENAGLDYIVMLKKKTHGFQAMYAKHAETIRLKVQYSLDSDSSAEMFGITDQVKIFNDSKDTATVGLFYQAKNGAIQVCNYIRQVKEAKLEAERLIAAGEIPKISKEFQGVLSVEKTSEGCRVIQNNEKFQEIIDKKGFSAIGSSKEMDAGKINQTYHSRDASEKGFRAFKSDLGNDVFRVHFSTSLHTKFLIGMIAGNIRNEFERACRELKYPTNIAIKELKWLVINLQADGKYVYTHTENGRQIDLMKRLHVSCTRNFDEVARDLMERREVTNHSPIRSITDYYAPKKAQEITVNNEASRNAGTSGQHADSSEKEQPSKRGPGRPPGSKNSLAGKG